MGKKSSQRLNDVSASEGVQNQIVQDFEEISSVADFCGRVTTSLFHEENTGHLKFCRSIFFCINRFQILMWCISNLHTWVLHNHLKVQNIHT
ncbi:unnamed protein product [Brassica rapa subsp. narinosa]